MVARWRKSPLPSGLRAIGAWPRGAELHDDGQCVITVSARSRSGQDGWYWYGLGKNTSSTPQPSLEEAKAEATRFYKMWKAQASSKQ